MSAGAEDAKAAPSIRLDSKCVFCNADDHATRKCNFERHSERRASKNDCYCYACIHKPKPGVEAVQALLGDKE
jgi:hypothetical protein